MTQSPQVIDILNSAGNLIAKAERFSHRAMATTFEMFILHTDAPYAQQAAYAAFDELDRLEAELSRFVENSDISRINNLAANRSLVVGPAVFECLQLCARMYAQTDGAFDITLGSTAKGCRLKLNEVQYAVQQPAKPVKIDLGGVGKGYAVDKMAELLNDWGGIDTALIHGGYSSVLALNGPSGTKGWPVVLNSPKDCKQPLARLHLQDRAVSASGSKNSRHIINPRTARPIEDERTVWVCGPDAATADALSTAFMVMSPDAVRQYCSSHPDVLAMMVTGDSSAKPRREQILRFGSWQESTLL